MKTNIFKINQFTHTEWNSAEDKLKFAHQFVLFIESDFLWTKFPKWFYLKLSNCFSNIAHYNIDGFYDAQFSSLSRRVNFVWNCLDHPCYGDPKFTYSDVERVLQNWLKENNILDKVRAESNKETEISEREQLKRLREKYEKVY